MKIIQSALALVAVVFGLMTIFVGSSVLLGSDPGYIVYQPLLIYNAAMGIVYVSAGVTVFRNITLGMYVAAFIFALNLVVLITIYYLYTKGSFIAIESVRAMSLRTVVWLILFVVLGGLSRRSGLYSGKPNA